MSDYDMYAKPDVEERIKVCMRMLEDTENINAYLSYGPYWEAELAVAVALRMELK